MAARKTQIGFAFVCFLSRRIMIHSHSFARAVGTTSTKPRKQKKAPIIRRSNFSVLADTFRLPSACRSCTSTADKIAPIVRSSNFSILADTFRLRADCRFCTSSADKIAGPSLLQ